MDIRGWSDGGSASIPSDNAASSVVSVTHVSIVFSNGLEVSNHNLSYQSLRGMIVVIRETQYGF